jgi:hypothetical protein
MRLYEQLSPIISAEPSPTSPPQRVQGEGAALVAGGSNTASMRFGSTVSTCSGWCLICSICAGSYRTVASVAAVRGDQHHGGTTPLPTCPMIRCHSDASHRTVLSARQVQPAKSSVAWH